MVNLNVVQPQELQPRITVFGVGGAGGNAVNNMIRSSLQGVEFVVANTDAQALSLSESHNRIQLGREVTQGLGAGSKPELGASAAEESLDQIEGFLDGIHMCFITAGMGGGTGTGAAPVIAKAARERGILTVAVVTKPFMFEGKRRMATADQGLASLHGMVDILVVIPNQNLFRVANAQTSLLEAFKLADDVLHAGVRSITDLMIMPGLINLDFNDVRTIMEGMGKAMMGTGEAEGEGRARKAAEAAVSNPLLDDISLLGAKGVLINITGGEDLSLMEVEEAAEFIRNEVDEDAVIILGSTHDTNMTGTMRVAVVATGLGDDDIQPAQLPPRAHAQPEPKDEDINAMPPREEEPLADTAVVETDKAQTSDAPVHHEHEPEDDPKLEEQEIIAQKPPSQAQTTQTRPHPLAASSHDQPRHVAPSMTPIPQSEPEVIEVPKTSIKGLIGGMFGRAKQAMTDTRAIPEETEKLLDGLQHQQPAHEAEPKMPTTKGRSKSPQDDPDQLEIPAFLRRRD